MPIILYQVKYDVNNRLVFYEIFKMFFQKMIGTVLRLRWVQTISVISY